MIPPLAHAIIVIRADAGHAAGAGHIMRCLALAQAWRRYKQGQAVFIGSISDKQIKARIKREGFRFIEQKRPYPDAADAAAMADLLAAQETKSAHWCVIDGYHFKESYTRLLRQQGWRVLQFDDYHHLEQYEADIILNQNLDAETINYRAAPWTSLLLGAYFAQIRQELLIHPPVHDQTRMAHRILLTFGGSDPGGLTRKAMGALSALEHQDLVLRVVIGESIKDADLIQASAAEMPFDCEIHTAVDDMAPLFSWADIALGAAGSTCWEMAYFGIPMILIIAAENQELTAAGLARRGAAINLGSSHNLRPEIIAAATRDLIYDQGKRHFMSEASRLLIDGQGPGRVVERLAPDRLRLRPVRDNDCRLIYQWANDKKIREASFSGENITWAEHKKWFTKIRRRPDHMFFIGLNSRNEEIGQLRFAPRGREAEISISLNPQSRGFGYGPRLLNLGIEEAWRHKDIQLIRARIKADNENSLRLFAQAGFEAEPPTIEVKRVAAVEMTLTRMTNHE